MVNTTITTIVVSYAAWLLLLGATLFFVYRRWVLPLRAKIIEQQNELGRHKILIDQSLVGVGEVNKIINTHKEVCDTSNKTTIKLVESHKAETTKIFETMTEAFEFINTERTQMIKDLAELKRRVRMTGNETKRNTIQRRRS